MSTQSSCLFPNDETFSNLEGDCGENDNKSPQNYDRLRISMCFKGTKTKQTKLVLSFYILLEINKKNEYNNN